MVRDGKSSKYVSIHVPREVRIMIKSTAMRMKMPMWRLIMESVSYFRTAYLEHFVSEDIRDDLSKIVWYIYKVSASFGSLRENPCKENLDLLLKTLKQIEERLDIDVSAARYSVEMYVKDPSKKNKIALNDAGKYVVAQLMSLAISKR